MAETSEKALMRGWSMVLARVVKAKQDVGEGAVRLWVPVAGGSHVPWMWGQ